MLAADHVHATIAVEMGGAPMYGPPYSTVSTSVGHYPHEELSTVLHVHTYQRHYNWADITQVRPSDRLTTTQVDTIGLADKQVDKHAS